MEGRVVLMGCGDIGPIQEPMDVYSTLVRPTLATADIRFGQVEAVYSSWGGKGRHLKPHMASIFSDCGFDVVSVAGNHTMEFGEDAALDMISILRKRGMRVLGAGRNLHEAREPVVIERNGIKVAFLAYCSILHEGHEAGANKVGVAPLRARARFELRDYQPGVPPIVITQPYEEDVEAMVEDIVKVKKSVHVVVLSMHWGVHWIPRIIADYQTIVAKAAFDAGADLILGHHAHVPKAISVYNGKVCFYSLGNFMFSSPEKTPAAAAEFTHRYDITLDPEFPRLPMGTDSRRTLIAKAVLTPKGVEKVSFLPALIDKQLRPEVLKYGDARFDEALRFMKWVSERYDPKFTIEGNEVVISAN